MGNVIVAQSGGPTTAINASLVGVVKGALASDKYDKIYGALHGISGVMKEDFILMNDKDLDLIYRTPASYLGSCRYKMPERGESKDVYEKVFEVLSKMDVSAFFYIGGNDSMDTIAKLSDYSREIGSSIRFAGVPKTIDNDLIKTDHTPGYGSAAKFIATSMLEMAHDTAVYEAPAVTIVEIMGRDAGWLTAAAALARNEYTSVPQLIYLPEVTFDKAQFIEDVKKLLETTNNIVVAVSEGIRDAEGAYISATSAANDKFGHAQLSGAGKCLELLVKQELGIKCRSVELNIPQRCAAHIASATDLKESMELGEKAVEYTLAGETGFMPVINRVADKPYSYNISLGDLDVIANQAKSVPREWINDKGNDIKQELIDYMLPLIQGEVEVAYKDGLPVYAALGHLTGKK
ncbi:MAG: 6-phosphofructokinase [Eubacterium sp.]|nr:6-phosphofructokinase [Eubacterium sp.]